MARRRTMNIKTGLYTMDLFPRENMVSKVHVRNTNWTKEVVDPSTDPVITLNNRYLALVKSGKYDLLRLGECYRKALSAYMVDRVQNTVEIMVRCYGDNHD